MASVFVIEQGSYSDYHVVGVFSTRENAETVLAALKAATESYYDTPGIAEWPLDPAIDALRAGLKRYTRAHAQGRNGGTHHAHLDRPLRRSFRFVP
jgi:hypothetical protein